MSICCPFCRNAIQDGAIVCGACNAYKSHQIRENAASAFFYLAAILTYLLYGPAVLLYGLWHMKLPIIGLGSVSTFVGWWIVWFIRKLGSRPHWYRRR